ncbi:MAG: DUF1326 domain-containing protein [Proteobacteria bacterium]|nr:DUF1326 domain-containing protein [Pseudomonadota bacterium]
MANVSWSMKGPEYVNCNCDYGCPCQFNALPTDGTCHAVTAMRIEEGHFGDVSLAGLCWAATLSWPNAIHEGNGTMQAIIDERADDDQRHALVEIVHGRETEPGATMLQVFSTTMTKVHDPLFMAIELDIDIDERTARLVVPGMIEGTMEPIRNPVTGNPHRARIDLPNGFEYTVAEVASGTSRTTGAIKLDLVNSHGHLSRLHLTDSGVVR